MLVLIFAIITTFSTTGFIVMALILVYNLVLQNDNLKNNPKQSILYLLLMGVLVIFALIYYDSISELIFDKMESGNNSYDSRTLSIKGNLILFLNHCLLGVGYGMSAHELNQVIASTSGYIHQTNTFTNYLATFGLIIGGFFIICWGKIAQILSKNYWELGYVFIILTMITSGENFLSSFAFTLFLAYGVKLINFEKNQMIC